MNNSYDYDNQNFNYDFNNYENNYNMSPKPKINLKKMLILGGVGVVVVVLIVVVLLIVNSNTSKLTGITISTDEIVVYVGGTSKIDVKSFGKNDISNTNINFDIEDKNIAKMEEKEQIGDDVEGIIKGKKAGETILNITAKLKRKEYKLKSKVIVCDKFNVKGISGNKIAINLLETKKIDLGYAEDSVCYKNLTFYLGSDENVVLNKNNSIKGIAVGSTTLTISDGKNQKKINVVVTDPYSKILATGVVLTTDSVVMKTGQTKEVAATVFPTTASNQGISWSSNKTSVATVDQKGVITAIANGTATIMAMAVDGSDKSASLKVMVTSTGTATTTQSLGSSTVVQAIKFTKSSYEVKKTQTVTANVAFTPSNVTNGTISVCSSSNTKIAIVQPKGNTCVITGIGVGKATISAITTDGSKKATATVNVTKEPVKIIVGTWNIGRSVKVRGMTAKKYADFIIQHKLDIIGLQEAKPLGKLEPYMKEMASLANMPAYVTANTPAGNAILSKYAITSSNITKLASCAESRSLLKSTMIIDGVTISFYVTHLSYQSGCPATQLVTVSNVFKSDPNPIILVADFNVGSQCNIITNALGTAYLIGSRDSLTNKCTDSIIVNGKGKLKVVDSQTIKTKGIYTDHNMVQATIEIIN